MSDELTELETAVLRETLSGHDPTATALRAQLDDLRVRERTFTGHGYYTELSVAPGTGPAPDVGDTLISGPNAEIDGMAYGAGFLLMVKDGYLATIEAFSYDGPWPTDIGRWRLIEPTRAGSPGD